MADKQSTATDAKSTGSSAASDASKSKSILSTAAFPLKHVTVHPEVIKLNSELIETRRTIHRQPELSLLEFKTAKLVADRLRSIGHIQVFEGVGQTGVVGLLRGTKSGARGKCIALRADMDALPMQEIDSQFNKEYKSQIAGVSHACGHDGHVSTLLCVARIAATTLRDKFSGAIKFIFQPGEEGKAGAKLMIADGVLDGAAPAASSGSGGAESTSSSGDGKFGPRVDEVYGLHYVGLIDFPVGAVGVRAGAFMASADNFKIEFKSPGGHGGMPHTTSDTIVAAAYCITQIQTIVSRNIHPIDSGVVSVGTIHGGYNDNIIADRVTLTGTFRTYSESTRALIMKRLTDIVNSTGTMFAVTPSLEFIIGYPPTVNSSTPHVNNVIAAASKVVGPTYVVDTNPVMGAEDFSFFLQRVPGAFFFVGSNPFHGMSGHPLPYADYNPPAMSDDSKAVVATKSVSSVLPLVSVNSPHVCSNHRPDFDIDERCMPIGASIFLQLIQDLLIAPTAASDSAASTK